MNTPEIYIAGAGRLTFSLSRALLGAGYTISGIFSRDVEEAQKRLQLPEISVLNYSEPGRKIHTLILAVPDSRLRETALQLSQTHAVEYLIHCSGAGAMSLITDIVPHAGVLYPLQTFTENRVIEFDQIPVLWEGDSVESEKYISGLAQKLSRHAEAANSVQRGILHTGAVFANNFTNFMVYLASRYAVSAEKESGIYQQLLEETMAKLRLLDPLVAQTGPARRGDRPTLERHLEIIREFHPADTDLYQLMSEKIYSCFNPEASEAK